MPHSRVTKSLFVALPALAAALVVKQGFPRFLRVTLNKALRRPGMRGAVEAVHVHPIAGVIAVTGLKLEAPGLPLVTLRRATVRWSWSRLLRGQVVGEILLDTPRVHVQLPLPARTPAAAPKEDWRAKAAALPPFLIKRLVVQEGTVHVLRDTGDTRLGFPVRDIELTLADITNSPRLAAAAPASGRGYARVADAPLSFNLEAALLMERPTFTGGLKLNNLEMAPLNDWLREYAGLTAEGGSLSVNAQAASKAGWMTGTVKVAADDARVKAHADGSLAQRLRESLVQAMINLFENNRSKRVATEVRFAGEWPKVKPKIGWLLRQAIRNAIAEPMPLDPAAAPAAARGPVFRRPGPR